MVFSSFIFLSVFLPLVLAAYYLLPRVCRNYVLLFFSMVFYLWGDAYFFQVMCSVIVVNYLGAIAVSRIREDKAALRKIVVSFFILANLAFLVYFKYSGFILSNVSHLFQLNMAIRKVVLPLGISFYVFQGLSYLIDVYRREIQVQTNILKLALFISFFPQLIAGPILKYHDIRDQIESRAETLDSFVYGLKRFIIGLGKKVILANSMGLVATLIFDTPSDQIDALTAWGGAIAYSLQLFFDFSGYSDMAIGLGAMFGFHFLENFNHPYVSLSVTEFWRRWHISLSTWFKEYLYIPLGGNRVSKARNLFNLFVVFLVTGIWHGAAWNFVAWGLLHGFFIILEKITGWHKVGDHFFSRLIHRIYLLFVIVVAWVLFRADSLQQGLQYLKVMFGFIHGQPLYSIRYFFTNWNLMILVVSVLLSTDLMNWFYEKTVLGTPKKFTMKLCSWGMDGFLFFVLIFSMILLAESTYNPFIYFRF